MCKTCEKARLKLERELETGAAWSGRMGGTVCTLRFFDKYKKVFWISVCGRRRAQTNCTVERRRLWKPTSYQASSIASLRKLGGANPETSSQCRLSCTVG